MLLAGLTRALVATALAETRRGTPPPAVPARLVAAALTAAARHGLAGAGVDPVTGQPAGAPALRARLLDYVYPALSDHGDTETITRLLRRLDQRGTGADRQRALFTSAASTPAFITALARATLSGHQPGRRRAPDARIPAAAGAQQGPEEEQYRIPRPHLEHWQPRQWCRGRQDDLLRPGAAGAFAGQRQRPAQPLRPVPGAAPGLVGHDHAHRQRLALHSARVLKVAACALSSGVRAQAGDRAE